MAHIGLPKPFQLLKMTVCLLEFSQLLGRQAEMSQRDAAVAHSAETVARIAEQTQHPFKARLRFLKPTQAVVKSGQLKDDFHVVLERGIGFLQMLQGLLVAVAGAADPSKAQVSLTIIRIDFQDLAIFLFGGVDLSVENQGARKIPAQQRHQSHIGSLDVHAFPVGLGRLLEITRLLINQSQSSKKHGRTGVDPDSSFLIFDSFLQLVPAAMELGEHAQGLFGGGTHFQMLFQGGDGFARAPGLTVEAAQHQQRVVVLGVQSPNGLILADCLVQGVAGGDSVTPSFAGQQLVVDGSQALVGAQVVRVDPGRRFELLQGFQDTVVSKVGAGYFRMELGGLGIVAKRFPILLLGLEEVAAFLEETPQAEVIVGSRSIRRPRFRLAGGGGGPLGLSRSRPQDRQCRQQASLHETRS